MARAGRGNPRRLGRAAEIGVLLAVEQRTDVQIGAAGDGDALQPHFVARHRSRDAGDQYLRLGAATGRLLSR